MWRSPLSQAAALDNQHLLARRSGRGPNALDGLDELLALDHFAKDRVLAVEMGGRDSGDEELRAIATWRLNSAFPHVAHGSNLEMGWD